MIPETCLMPSGAMGDFRSAMFSSIRISSAAVGIQIAKLAFMALSAVGPSGVARYRLQNVMNEIPKSLYTRRRQKRVVI